MRLAEEVVEEVEEAASITPSMAATETLGMEDEEWEVDEVGITVAPLDKAVTMRLIAMMIRGLHHHPPPPRALISLANSIMATLPRRNNKDVMASKAGATTKEAEEDGATKPILPRRTLRLPRMDSMAAIHLGEVVVVVVMVATTVAEEVVEPPVSTTVCRVVDILRNADTNSPLCANAVLALARCLEFCHVHNFSERTGRPFNYLSILDSLYIVL